MRNLFAKAFVFQSLSSNEHIKYTLPIFPPRESIARFILLPLHDSYVIGVFTSSKG